VRWSTLQRLLVICALTAILCLVAMSVDGSAASDAAKPHPDELKRLLTTPDSASIRASLAALSTARGFQLGLFHLYRGQADLTLRLKAAQLQRDTIDSTVSQARSGDDGAKNELVTLKGTLDTFVQMAACPAELKPLLMEILDIVQQATKH
jgi:hypothetical protein